MEWLEPLLPFLILFIYLIRQLRKRSAAPAQPPAAPPTAGVEQAPTPFESLVRQIQEAAEQSRQAQPPPVVRATPPWGSIPAPRPLTPRPIPPRPLVPPPSEFHSVGGFEHDRHGFGPESPFSEEAFERRPRGADVTEHAPGHLTQGPHDLNRLFQAPKKRHPLAERLRHRGSARDAFALHEILSAPRSRRRR